MPRWMPVLSENHMFEMPSEFVDLWYERISIGYRKRTSRTEVILNVDYQERFHKGGLSIEENQKSKGVASCSFWQIGPYINTLDTGSFEIQIRSSLAKEIPGPDIR